MDSGQVHLAFPVKKNGRSGGRDFFFFFFPNFIFYKLECTGGGEKNIFLEK